MQEFNRNGHRQRLRKQFLANGISGISDCNVLELYLSLIIPRKDVKLLAYALMNRYATLENVFSADKDELMTFKGIGEHTAEAIGIFNELLKRNTKTYKSNMYDFNKPDSRAEFINTLLEEKCYDIVFVFLDNGLNYLGEMGCDSSFEFDSVFKNELVRNILHLNIGFVIVGRKSDSKKFSESDYKLVPEIKLFLISFGVVFYDYICCSQNDVVLMSQSKNKRMLSRAD